jgi:Xaa-Pro aminopeptidase
LTDRPGRVVAQLEERGLDALVVTHLVNLRWATGFTGSNGAAIIGRDERVFLTDFRYTERAQHEVPDFERVKAGRDLLADVAARLSGRVGFDDAHMSVREHARLRELAADVELVPTAGLIEALRAVKDEGELAAIRAAATLANGAYEMLAEQGLSGRTEAEVAWAIERDLRERGAQALSFEPIVAAGANGALPHALPGDTPIAPNTLVVLDLGCIVDGYCSDCTRTFATGPLDDELEQAYELVLDAQQRSLAAVVAGATCSAVDAVARDIIDAGGHGERFGHGLGHGVGLEVHEAPRLGQTSEEVLTAGNVVTVEPGVYVPGRFGVRIEDLVIVGHDGPEVLTAFPKDLTRVG